MSESSVDEDGGFDNLINERLKSEDQSLSIKKPPSFFSPDGKWCYQFSIIDYLQTFDSGKKNEVLAKKLFKNADPSKLSAVPPDPYADRFSKFMKDTVFTYDKKEYIMDIASIIKELEDKIKKLFAEKLRDIF